MVQKGGSGGSALIEGARAPDWRNWAVDGARRQPWMQGVGLVARDGCPRAVERGGSNAHSPSSPPFPCFCFHHGDRKRSSSCFGHGGQSFSSTSCPCLGCSHRSRRQNTRQGRVARLGSTQLPRSRRPGWSACRFSSNRSITGKGPYEGHDARVHCRATRSSL